MYEALDALGLDPTRVYRSVYRRIPLPPPTLGGRLVHDNAPLFWTELAAVTGDADIGLHLGEAMKPRLLDVVGYLLLSARDLEEALRSSCVSSTFSPAVSPRASRSKGKRQG